MHTRSKDKKSTTTNPKMLEEDSPYASVYENPMHSRALKPIASAQEVVPFSKDVALTPMSKQGTSESLQLNQPIVALEPSDTDASNSRIHSNYPTSSIQDPNMRSADSIVINPSQNAVAERITKTTDDARTRISSSAHLISSHSSTSSRTSAKSKRAVLMARLQAQAEINALEQGSPTGGPRAACGPPRCLVRPAEGVSIQI